jgi:hypothetical protein
VDRTEVERRSAVLLVALSRQPTWLLGLVAAGLLAGVVFGPAPLALGCMAVLVAVLAWLSYLSWPVTDARARGLRLLALGLLIVLGLQSVAS